MRNLVNNTTINYTNIRNYNSFHKIRIDGYGGVSIYIKKQYTFSSKIINDNDPIEAIECEITNSPLKLKIISIYIPPNIASDIIKNNFKNLLNKYNNLPNVLIAGDINAHHGL